MPSRRHTAATTAILFAWGDLLFYSDARPRQFQFTHGMQPFELAKITAGEIREVFAALLMSARMDSCSIRAGCRVQRLCWLRESTLPSGSLNHATLSPLGVVQIPRTLSSTKEYFSNWTPRPLSHVTTASTSCTSQPITVYWAGWKFAPLAMPYHVFPGLHDQRVLIIAYKLQAKFTFIKIPGAFGIFGGNEPYELAAAIIGSLRHVDSP